MILYNRFCKRPQDISLGTMEKRVFKQGAGSEDSQRSSGLLLSDNPFSPNAIHAAFVPQLKEYQ